MGAIHQFSQVLTGGMGVDALREFRHGACPVRCAGLEGAGLPLVNGPLVLVLQWFSNSATTFF